MSDEESWQFHNDFIRERLPAVSPTTARAAVCVYTVTPDKGFVLDWHPQHKRVFIASPCSGHGFKHSAAIGESIAQTMTTGASSIDLQPFALRRFMRS